jgi:hypothetical protein
MITNFFHPCLSLLFLDPGSEIRDKHPGSATLALSINSLSVLEKNVTLYQGLSGRGEQTDGT